MTKRRRTILTILLSLFIASLPTVSGIGPPTNPLNLFVRYDIGWVDQNTGRFGGNITFFRSQSSTFDSNWALMVKFPSTKTSIDTFANSKQWHVERESDGTFRVSIKNENILNDDPALVQEDDRRGLRRFNFYFNGGVTAPASKSDLFPNAYRLMVSLTDPNARTLALTDQKDFANTDLVRGTPNQPFGPFNVPQTNRIDYNSAGVYPDNPSPNGTELATAPIGLVIYLVISAIAGTAFTIGTIDRAKYRLDFLKQASEQSMPRIKNRFVAY